MKTVFLVRHGRHAEVGKVLSGRSEIGLNADGLAQAEALAEAFSNASIASLHSSPRRRALETIAPLSERLGMRVRRTEALDEIDFGDFTGRSFSALEADEAWQFWNARRDIACCPGGETMAGAVARALAYLRQLPDKCMPALCVTHCDIIRGILADQAGLGPDGLFRFECDAGSVTRLAVKGRSLRPVSINVPPEAPKAEALPGW